MKTDELQAAAEAILEHGDVNIPEAVMKSIEMEPREIKFNYSVPAMVICPRCFSELTKCKYCKDCGQKIKWPPIISTDRGDPCP